MQIFAFLLLLLNISGTFFFYTQEVHISNLNYLYNLTCGLNFLVASLLAFSYEKKFRSYSIPLVLFALGFLSFFVAQMAWMYYNLFVMSEVPYPGIADLFFLIFYALVISALILMLKKLGSKIALANFIEIIFVSALFFLIISSFLSLYESQAGLPLLTRLLNYAYPVFDSLLIAAGIMALRTQVGHLNPLILYFVFGFMCLAFGDTFFAYQTTLGTYWNGNVTDLMFASSGFFLLMGTISMPKLFIAVGRNEIVL